MTVRIGLIGTGFGATVQAPGFQCLEGAELVAVASGRLERAKAVTLEHGVAHAFDDYREMLRSVELDLVSIATPPDLHHEMVMAALDAGAHVLCEKPFALDIRQAGEMLDAAERLGRVHAIDHEFRYIPARAAMKRLLDSGEIGDLFLLRMADLSVRGGFRAWWFDRSRGGGLLGAVGSHYVDATRWWLGEFDRVSADLRAVVPERTIDGAPVGVTSDDTVAVAFRLHNGASGRIDLSIAAPAGARRVEIYGSHGSLFLDGTTVSLATDGDAQEVPLENRDQGRLDDFRLGPFVELAQRVVDRISGKDSGPFPTFADGLEVQRVMDAIHLSSDERREVQLEELAP